ncbi:SDR family NAD(P)-dependent oxidoreductase, partial [Nocardia tengchongensis]|uniref:SDR family NAD(P)-dependent oxidoreductase n=1 Tax=Nocardia tengchongensis TaxID=2055889 RepID=UPI0036D0DDEB
MAIRLPPALDTALDRTVALGYGRTGFHLRRGAWPALPANALRGRTALVTGANSGIGKAIAAGMADLGATVTLLVRNEARGVSAAAEIAAAVPNARLRVERCDVADLTDVRRFATEFAERTERLDVLVHNAGV